jgi:hypothetical protein
MRREKMVRRLAQKSWHKLQSLADRRWLPTTLKKTMALCIVVQAETGSHMSEWLDSPGLQPPK